MHDQLTTRAHDVAPATTNVGFSGFIHGVSLVDLLQLFHYSRLSLTLHVAPDAKVHLESGEIVHASTGTLRGDSAVSYLLKLEAGQLRTAPPEPVSRTIHRTFNLLLLDALREIDEASRNDDAPSGTRASRRPSASAGATELLQAACVQLAERLEEVRAVILYDHQKRLVVAHDGATPGAELDALCSATLARPRLNALAAALSGDERSSTSDWDEVRCIGDAEIVFAKSLSARPWALVVWSKNPDSPGIAWTELRHSALMLERILI